MNSVHGTKNIRKTSKYDRYVVQKFVDGEAKYYGTYPSLIIALMVRDWFDAYGWPKTGVNNFSNPEKYIVKYDDKFRIVHKCGNKTCYFGVYDTLEEARDVKVALIGAGWPYVSKCNKYDLPKYICYSASNYYVIQKRINNERKYFGSFKTLKSALEERDYLISHNWKYPDFEAIDDRVDGECMWLGRKVNV